MTRLELFRIKSMWGNYTFDYACSLSRGRSGGLISVWDPNHFTKEQIWCDNWYIIVKGRWASSDNLFFMINIYGPHKTADKIALWNRLLEFIRNHECHFVLFRDLNEVRDESERYGTEFHRPSANNFNSFINDAGLLELPLGGHIFPNVKVSALSRGWSNHTPIMLHCNKVDFGPIPFKFFHLWLQRDGFDDCIKKAYNECSLINPEMSFHEKLKCLKQNIKEWNRKSISIIASRKHEVLRKLTDIKDNINSNTTSDIDKEDRVKLLKEQDDIQQLEDMDLIQKDKVKWDVEGDENTKFFHGILKQKRFYQSVQGIMIDREWVTNPHQVKLAFYNFFKDKFDVSDSSIELSSVIPSSTLSQNDNLELEKPVSDEEIRLAV
ncbi:RNA-directed DNA polymerase, eukaryota, reverse transcriptase zinc-binding domain protein [Tanacetum coccineum]